MEITGEERERKRESKTLLSIQNRTLFLRNPFSYGYIMPTLKIQ